MATTIFDKPLDHDVSEKLNTGNVYNGLDKESSGYALDARQGKALNQAIGTLNTQTSQLTDAIIANLSYSSATCELINGTGTFRNYPTVGYNDKYISITGALRVINFSRTGSNPGLKITLPVNAVTRYVYTPIMTTCVGSEFATTSVSSNELRTTVSESSANYNNPYMTIIFGNTILQRL